PLPPRCDWTRIVGCGRRLGYVGSKLGASSLYRRNVDRDQKVYPARIVSVARVSANMFRSWSSCRVSSWRRCARARQTKKYAVSMPVRRMEPDSASRPNRSSMLLFIFVSGRFRIDCCC
ncbi:unnamed protein product, partial [Ectocarpus fasciculatus]